jgi:hypothetical protein
LLVAGAACYLGAMSRVLLLDADKTHDVFDVVELTESLARVRTPFLYEIGEELRVRLESNGKSREVVARVRAHTGPADDKITELELA